MLLAASAQRVQWELPRQREATPVRCRATHVISAKSREAACISTLLPRQSIALASRTACDSLTVSKMALAPTCGWAGGTCVNAAGRGRDACAAGAHQIVAKDCGEQLATERLLGARALGGGTAERWPLLRLCEHAHAAEEQRGTEKQPGHWRKTERGNADSDASGGLLFERSHQREIAFRHYHRNDGPGNGTASQVGWRSFPARSRSSRA
jgi:hypothetical protein